MGIPQPEEHGLLIGEADLEVQPLRKATGPEGRFAFGTRTIERIREYRIGTIYSGGEAKEKNGGRGVLPITWLMQVL